MEEMRHRWRHPGAIFFLSIYVLARERARLGIENVFVESVCAC